MNHCFWLWTQEHVEIQDSTNGSICQCRIRGEAVIWNKSIDLLKILSQKRLLSKTERTKEKLFSISWQKLGLEGSFFLFIHLFHVKFYDFFFVVIKNPNLQGLKVNDRGGLETGNISFYSV